MADIYKSKYTGEQIEGLLDKVDKLDGIEMNPIAAPTETANTIKVGDTIYEFDKGTQVVANPISGGNPLNRISINGVNYTIPSGESSGDIYYHHMEFDVYSQDFQSYGSGTLHIISSKRDRYGSLSTVPNGVFKMLELSFGNKIVLNARMGYNNTMYYDTIENNNLVTQTASPDYFGTELVYDMSGALV